MTRYWYPSEKYHFIRSSRLCGTPITPRPGRPVTAAISRVQSSEAGPGVKVHNSFAHA